MEGTGIAQVLTEAGLISPSSPSGVFCVKVY